MKIKKPIKLLTFKGAGAFKECYSISRNEVALVPRADGHGSVDIRLEFEQIKKLKKYKIPVPKTRLGIVNYDGKVVEAMILPKFSENLRAGHFRCVPKVPKEKLAKQIENILKIVKRHKIYMEDMQFLVNYKTGKVVVSDPGEVTINNREWYKDCVEELENALTSLKDF